MRICLRTTVSSFVRGSTSPYLHAAGSAGVGFKVSPWQAPCMALAQSKWPGMSDRAAPDRQDCDQHVVRADQPPAHAGQALSALLSACQSTLTLLTACCRSTPSARCHFQTISTQSSMHGAGVNKLRACVPLGLTGPPPA